MERDYFRLKQSFGLFEEVLKKKLQPSQLFHHLTFLSSDDKELILNTENTKNYAEATTILLHLVSKSNTYDVYLQVKNAIKKQGFEYIDLLLEGSTEAAIEDDEMCRNFFLSCSGNILQCDPKHIVPYLVREQVINENDGQRIINQASANDDLVANHILQIYVSKKKVDWLPKTVWAYCQAGYIQYFEDILRGCGDTDPEMEEKHALDTYTRDDVFCAIEKWREEYKRTQEALREKQLSQETYLDQDSYCLVDSPSKKKKDATARELTIPMEKKVLSLREYQKELTECAKDGENCLMQAPTGSGKTYVAMEIARHHLEKQKSNNRPGKVAFLVPYTYLVQQQCTTFKTFLNERCVGLHGARKPGDFVDLPSNLLINNILVMTPQLLVEALKRKDLKSINDFTLIIFDECHHTVGNNPYNRLMKIYLKEKWENKVDVPQIIGLTASVGVGKANTLDNATEHILKLCASLDSNLCEVTRNKEDLQKHANDPREEIFKVMGRSSDPFYDELCKIMTWIEDEMKYAKEVISVQNENIFPNEDFVTMLESKGKPGSLQYKQWVCEIEQKIARIPDQRRGVFVACLFHLLVYTNALEIHQDCRSVDALEFIERMFNSNIDYRKEIDKWKATYIDKSLFSMYKTKETRLRTLSSSHLNPKLDVLKKLVLKYTKESTSSRGMIICKTLNISKALHNWAKSERDFKLEGIDAGRLVGSRASDDKGGISQEEQKKEIQDFDSGKIRLLISTFSEGLDIAECNFVINYEHATSEVVRIQSKGRNRAKDSVHATVADPSSGNIEREERSKAKEYLMYEAIKAVKKISQFEFREEIERIQQQMLIDERNKCEIVPEFQSESSQFTIRCKKCDALVCSAESLRSLLENHHIVIDVKVYDRVKRQRHKKGKMIGQGIEKKEKLLCKKDCGQDWGINAIYKDVNIPILKKGNALVYYDEKKKASEALIEWKNLPFKIKDLDDHDFNQYVKEIKQYLAFSNSNSQQSVSQVSSGINVYERPSSGQESICDSTTGESSSQDMPMDQQLSVEGSNTVHSHENQSDNDQSSPPLPSTKVDVSDDVLMLPNTHNSIEASSSSPASSGIQGSLKKDLNKVIQMLNKNKAQLKELFTLADIEMENNEAGELIRKWQDKHGASNEVDVWNKFLQLLQHKNYGKVEKTLQWALEKLLLRKNKLIFQRRIRQYEDILEEFKAKLIFSDNEIEQLEDSCDTEDFIEHLFENILLLGSKSNFDDFRNIMNRKQPELGKLIDLTQLYPSGN